MAAAGVTLKPKNSTSVDERGIWPLTKKNSMPSAHPNGSPPSL